MLPFRRIVFFILVGCVTAEFRYMECKITDQPVPVLFEFNFDWSPLGCQRVFDLLESGFFKEQALYRVSKNFLVQFGIPGDPKIRDYWREQPALPDEPKPAELQDKYHGVFQKGWISFAGAGPNSRSHHLFIAFKNSTGLGKADHETPLGKVVSGWESVLGINGEYGDMKPFNENGVDFGRALREGYSYLRAEFPNLSYMYDCREVLDDPLELPPNGPEPPRTKTGLVHAAPLQQGFEGQKLQALSAKGPGVPWLMIIAVVAFLGLAARIYSQAAAPPAPTKRHTVV